MKGRERIGEILIEHFIPLKPTALKNQYIWRSELTKVNQVLQAIEDEIKGCMGNDSPILKDSWNARSKHFWDNWGEK